MGIQTIKGSVADPQTVINTANIVTKLELNLSINTQTGTSYTLLSTDNGKLITLSNAAAITLTIPAGLGVGFNCELAQLGAGQVTITASGTTLNSSGGLLTTSTQFSLASVQAYLTNTFLVGGDLV